MSKTLNENMKDAGRAVSDAAKNVGKTIAEGAERATRAVEEATGVGGRVEGENVGVEGIKGHMKVIGSCGKTVGVVDGVEGSSIKLTRKDSPDGKHHFLPLSWVQRVDNHVHLNKNSLEAEQGWKSDSSSCCGCGS